VFATGRRVQRVPETWPVLHLETSVPTWDGLSVEGLVCRPLSFDLPALQRLGAEEREAAVHCVWGWSLTDSSWTGIPLARLLDETGPLASWVTVRAASGVYSSCLPVADARRGLLVWERDGAPLSPEAGGPLRYLPPEGYWGYKGVKWAARVTVGDRFVPGFWESKVADPHGRIPDDVELP
jgi:DMSO/TMAO reductase YedYZ molybdopterin-dependent catalytic subunit